MSSNKEQIDITYFDEITFIIEEHPNLEFNINVHDAEKLSYVITLETNLDKELELLLLNSELFRPVFMTKGELLTIIFAYPGFTGTTEETLITNQTIELTFEIPKELNYQIKTFNNTEENNGAKIAKSKTD